MASLLGWLFGPARPLVWLVQDESGCWHKVVCFGRPNVKFVWYLLGPFRSEVDAEETADRLNTVRAHARVRLYNPVETVVVPPAGDATPEA